MIKRSKTDRWMTTTLSRKPGKPFSFNVNICSRKEQSGRSWNSLTHIPQLPADSSPSPRCRGRIGRGTVDCFQYTDVVSYDPGCKAKVGGLRKGLPWKHHIQNQTPSSWGTVDSTQLVRKALSSLKNKYNYVTQKDNLAILILVEW